MADTRWEYLIAKATVFDLEERLNDFGQARWELVHAQLHTGHYELIFKRPTGLRLMEEA